ncbi:AIPR family protein [Candidatus Venteria ishoeyi]|uniref:TPR repeat-containing protein YrrB n=1 Tax=Candidatus Venteria ishoeyi TaxID=1899563 RepID=A0A1H6F5H1_9GAMM|nr:AIPR family protein [Candidatus Venteria ishoeyi]SEH04326.1 TPR repeat-containing protein YrrB [Candidatus Venteria ishoeyi]
MRTELFCQTLDQELDDLLVEYQADEVLQKLKQPEQKKSYAFLLWFLRFYSSTQIHFRDNITEGKDDSSCDIILSKPGADKCNCFYIIQSKWRKNPLKSNGTSDDIKKALSDFEAILHGTRIPGKNIRFNNQYSDLKNHLAENGDVKFIFLMLAPYNDDIRSNVTDNIRSFTYNHPTSVDIIDLNRLKYDFIDKRYKRIQPDNPLDYLHNPESAEIKLNIERISNETEQGDYIRVIKPFESYIFFIKPKTVFELFDTYGFHLFAQNIRNPLPDSNYNEKIVDTMTYKPGSFWYFNNGVSAITRILPKAIQRTAEKITITGLQIINGAQTFYSVYRAYKSADLVTRTEMDDNALISIRLIKTNDPDMNRQITLFTNSQNRVFDRDFHANDEIQIRLQHESFQGSIWYEKRRGEFNYANKPDGVEIVSNEIFAHCYLSYYLEQCLSTIPIIEKDKNFLFTARTSHEHGLYEKIFNEDTKFNDMLASLYVYRSCCKIFNWNEEEFPVLFSETGTKKVIVTVFIMPLFKAVANKYAEKYARPEMANLTKWIIKSYKDDNVLLEKIIIFITDFFADLDKKDKKRASQSSAYFDILKIKIEDNEISVDGVDSIRPDVFSHFEIAQKHYYNDEYEEALTACNALLEIQDDHFNALHLMSNILLDLNRYEEAEDYCKKALSIKPKHEQLWYNLGSILRELKKYPEAEAAYHKQIEIKPDHEYAWDGLGNVLENQEKYPEAEDAYRKQIELKPDHEYAWYGLGNTLRSQEKHPEAEAAYRKQIEIKPDHEYAWYGLGNALGNQEKHPESEAAYRKQIEIKPDHEYAWYGLGNALGNQEKHPEAEAAYRKQIEIKPDHEYAWYGLGNALRSQEKHPEAEDAYRKQIEIKPDHEYAWYGLGNALRSQEKHPEAEAAYRKQIEIKPDHKYAWDGLGNALRSQEKHPEAEDAYRKQIEIKPDHEYAWYGLGNALRSQEKPPEAEDAYRKQIEIKPDHEYAWYGLGNALRSQENPRS